MDFDNLKVLRKRVQKLRLRNKQLSDEIVSKEYNINQIDRKCEAIATQINVMVENEFSIQTAADIENVEHKSVAKVMEENQQEFENIIALATKNRNALNNNLSNSEQNNQLIMYTNEKLKMQVQVTDAQEMLAKLMEEHEEQVKKLTIQKNRTSALIIRQRKLLQNEKSKLIVKKGTVMELQAKLKYIN